MRRNLLLAALTIVLLVIPPARSNDVLALDDSEATTLAQQILDKGAQLYSAKDAQAMAATYTEDAELTIVSKKRSEMKTEVKHGRDAIEQTYRDLYQNAGVIQAKNTVEYARLLDTDLLLVGGVFQPNSDSLRVPFVQVRVKQGDRWLINSLRIFLVDKNG
jgi:hypothetical protein